MRTSRPAALVSTLCLLLPASRVAAEARFLPEVAVHLKAARYAPSEDDLQWTGWIGAGAGLVSVAGATLYLRGDAETILGGKHWGFEANQVNYRLEVGVHRPLRGGDVSLFFHHVSRHSVDRAKAQKVDWNLPGLRWTGRLPKQFPVPAWLTLSVGRTTLTTFVDYRWELMARADLELLARPRGRIYLLPELRLVLAEAGSARDAFSDVLIEAGARFVRDGRLIEPFVAYEHRNDVLLIEPGARDRALIGFRIRFYDGGPTNPHGAAAEHGPWRPE